MRKRWWFACLLGLLIIPVVVWFTDRPVCYTDDVAEKLGECDCVADVEKVIGKAQWEKASPLLDPARPYWVLEDEQPGIIWYVQPTKTETGEFALAFRPVRTESFLARLRRLVGL